MNMMLRKLMAIKPKKRDMPEVEKLGKMSALSKFDDMAKDAMGKKLEGGLKKVTVASDSPEGLEAGLMKAKDMVENGPEGEVKACDEHSSPEELDMEIERLMALKAKKEEDSESSEEEASEDDMGADDSM